MKKSSPVRASHVNDGTSIPRSELRSNSQRGRELRHPKRQASVESSDATSVGGLALAARLVATLRGAQRVDSELCLLKSHRPFHESDHVLTHVYNLFVGGTCIEDIADRCAPSREEFGAGAEGFWAGPGVPKPRTLGGPK